MSARPKVLDLFCCAGGVSMGYHRAGFDVTGVDIDPQPRYPFECVQADALEVLSDEEFVRQFDLVHTSPPCQAACTITKGTNARLNKEYPNHYAAVRECLVSYGIPSVIENPEARPDVVLCGEMFGLGVLRHRKFELIGWTADKPKHKPHRGRVRGYRHGVWYNGPYIAAYGDGGGKGTVEEMQRAMGIDWTDVRHELTEALPPAYGEWIGREFLSQLPITLVRAA